MRPGPRSSCIALLVLVAGLSTLGTAWSTPGVVLSSPKISTTAGGFPGPLDNLDEFGGAVAWLGDLDGNGPSVAALAVGAALDDDGSGDRGAVWILFLSSSGTVLSSTKISDLVNLPGQPLDGNDQFGSSLAWLGDLDGEMGPSVAALAVGSPLDDDGGTDRGAVFILFLSSSGTVLTVQKISALEGTFGGTLDNLDEFGGAIANLGDLDDLGPSARAIAVGAGGDDDGGADRGAAWILFIGTDGKVKSYSKISSTQGNFAGPLDNTDDFGGALACLNDLDGMGPSAIALAVGATFDDDGPMGAIDRGAVWILFLTQQGSVLSAQKISDTQGNFNDFLSDADEFGGALALLPDIDGIPGGAAATLAVGITGDDDGGEDRGAAQILFLNSNGTCLASQKISDFFGGFTPALHNLDGFGSSLSFVGDINGAGAGVATLACGLTGDDDGPIGSVDRGAVYLLNLDGISYVGVDPEAGPDGSMLGRPSPNPAHPNTRIPFRLAREADVSIAVWDVRGRLVRTLVRGVQTTGSHAIDWDGRDDAGRDLPTGTYFYRLDIDGRPASRAQKAMLLR